VAASVRDILVAPENPGRVEEAHRRLQTYYDAVLVHGDPALAPLELSWPLDEQSRRLVHYTGYVDQDGEAIDWHHRRRGTEIVVSGGSSAASLPLYRATIEAARALKDRPWRILVGAGVAEED